MNKPSASSMDRLAACPGSWAMCQDGPPRVDSEDATRGTEIHAWLEKAFPVLLSSHDVDEAVEKMAAHPLAPDALEVAGKCLEQLDRYLTHTLGPTWGKELKFETEVRRWHPLGFYSGKADLVIRAGFHHYVVDYKSGYEPVTAADNLQLRALAVLESYFFALTVTCVIIQPTIRREPLVVHYNVMDISTAEQEVNAIVEASQKPDAPRRAGDHCKYCPAKTICPEALANVFALERMDGNKELTTDQIARLLPICDQADDVIADIRQRARAALQFNPEAIPGWTLKPGRINRPIVQPETVFARSLELGVTQADFIQCVSVAKGDLKAVIGKATGAKGKALDAKISELLDGCTEEKQCAPTLERVKE